MPETPAQLRWAAQRVAGHDVQALHVHPKDADGRDCLDATVVDAAVAATRLGASALPIGVTTGEWAMPSVDDRLRAIAAWQVLPDFASVNWHEPGAEEVAAALLDRGIAVEAGLWTVAAVERWAGSTVGGQAMRVLIELPDGLAETATPGAADDLIALVRQARPDSSLLLHGAGTSCWPAFRHAVNLGLATRIGLEDTLLRPDGSPAADNLDVVLAALHFAAK